MILRASEAPPAAELAELHDDDQEPLRVRVLGARWRPVADRLVEITRADGSELSALEMTHVRAAMAARKEQ